MLYEVLMVIYLLVAMALIGLVLIQRGKGADMGASFGAGASNTVFGSTGSGNFLTRSTAVLATLFFAISLVLGAMTAGKEKQVDEWQDLEVPVSQAPAAMPADSDVPAEQQEPSDVPN
ncbi:preprotein translocase subunit SecG [Aliiglaciecola sp. CAU 1673]|uniref:preprotein translocase subunit SecG n=1 Tax=Aliiglaciecola sp. CAU 1673 TaxID=3032595 RepID=UPI0023DC3878|nr:preprotein translocase subunit SecG [Aliiglaciecola sp. CAU 1673]MDF2179418.1 preprotein translocase subunit SecG [Aliiglaciecola sp. CAU 1673]